MDVHETIASLSLVEGLELLKTPEDNFGVLELEVPGTSILSLLDELRALGYDFLADLTAVHYPHEAGRELAVVYHLVDMRTRDRIRIKTFTSEEKPEVPSATGIYAAANWMERETYDFYGIQFQGHPDLRRILNVDEMDYHPMRKQYPLEDQTREDKDDEMFGRKSLKEY